MVSYTDEETPIFPVVVLGFWCVCVCVCFVLLCFGFCFVFVFFLGGEEILSVSFRSIEFLLPWGPS